VLQNLISFAEDNLHLTTFDELRIIRIFKSGRSCDDWLQFWESGSDAKHCRQIVMQFLLPTSCKQCENRFLCQMLIFQKMVTVFFNLIAKISHRIDRRISDIFNRIIHLLVKLNFKRQNTEHLVHIFANAFDAIAFPSPDFR